MSDYRKAVAHTTRKVTQPVAKTHLASNLKWRAFEEEARKTFLAAAIQLLRENGEKPSVSRLAALTGWQRAEVRRVRSLSEDEPAGASGETDSLAQRVLDGWWTDAEFRDGNAPLDLPMRGPVPSVVTLVKRYTNNDQRAAGILKDWLRAGAVQRLDSGTYKLVRKTCFIAADPRGLKQLANAANLHLRAAFENMEHPELDPHCVSTINVENLDPEHARILVGRFAEDLQVLRESISRTLQNKRYQAGAGKDGVTIHLGIQMLKLSSGGKLLRRGATESTRNKRKELKSAADPVQRGGRS